MKVTRFSHAAILVNDVEEAKKFFSDLLGLEFAEIVEVKETDAKNAMSPLGIEVVSPLTPDGPVAKALERRGEGLTMIALDVPDIEEAIADMKAKGIRMLGRADLPIGKTATFHPKDLHGVMIELIER